MKINFTKKQFETLLKTVYMGSWIANANRTNTQGDEFIVKYKELEKYLLSFAKDFGLEKYVDNSGGEIYPSIDLEEDEVMDLIDEYDNDTFWEEIINRLVNRDFMREYENNILNKMDVFERIEKEHQFLEKYHDEIDKYGIKRLEIVE